jgi:HAD superfamily hydrolase (TIGR01549 family)
MNDSVYHGGIGLKGGDGMIGAILFDLDDTLIVDEAVSREALLEAARLAEGADHLRLAEAAAAAARRLWTASPFAAYCQRIGHSAFEGLWARYDSGDHPAIDGLREWAPGYRARVWQEALASQGIGAGILAEAMAARFFAARRRYPLYPEVLRLLEALRGRCKLGIVTNGVPDLQREKLNGCGVLTLFDASIVSGEIDCGKPDPGIFSYICDQLGVRPADCVMVGDNPARDVAGAAAAGMRSVWVSRGGRPSDPRFPADLSCDSLLAILPWLGRNFSPSSRI